MLEQRFLTGGLDSDTAPHNMEKDALLNAVNIRTVVSKTQNSTNVQLIRGNVDCNTYVKIVSVNSGVGIAIVVTLNSNASLKDGDMVSIAGVLGNTAANGIHWIKLQSGSSTNIELYTSYTLATAVGGNGTYTANTGVINAWQSAMAYSGYVPHTAPSGYSTYGLEPKYVEKGKCVDGTDIYYLMQDYNYVGGGGNIAVSITGSTNTGGGFFTITTATNHGFANGDTVYIQGISSSGSGNINGIRVISSITLTTFKITYSSSDTYTPTAHANCTNSPFVYSANFTTGWNFIPPESKIVKYDTLTGETTVILSEYWTDATLTDDWYAVADNFIDCGVSDGKLFWCDPTPRYIDLSINYLQEYTNNLTGGTLPAYANGYSPATPLTTFSANVLSLITEPSIVPLTFVESSNSGVSSTIQYKALQFCVRFTNQSGFHSVLSPYSLTKLPVRQSDIVSIASYYNNIVGVMLPVPFDSGTGLHGQTIPSNWQTIEYIVRDLETNSFYCIGTWERDNASDVAEVDAHNANTTPLTFSNYYGVNKYAIDSGSVEKQFDAVPLSAKSLALVANRLLLGDIVEGYDAPSINNAWSVISTNSVNTIAPTVLATTDVYFVSVADDGDNTIQRGTYVVRCDLGLGAGVKTYLLSPTDFYRARFKLDLALIYVTDSPLFENTTLFSTPESINYKYLIDANNQDDPKLNIPSFSSGAPEIQIRMDIVKQAFGSDTFVPSSNHLLCISAPYGTFNGAGMAIGVQIAVVNDAEEYATGGVSRAFSPNANYRGSVRLYDDGGRTCGIFSNIQFSIPEFDPHNLELIESNTIQINTSSVIPDWAKYFSFNLSKEQSSDKVITFIPDCIKIAIKNNIGEYKFVGREQGVTTFNQYSYVGLAIPISSITQYGYDYKSGDKIILTIDNGSSYDIIRGNITDYNSGYIIVNIDNTSLLDNFVNSGSTSIYYPTTTGVGYMYIKHFFAPSDWTLYAQKTVYCQLLTDTSDINTYEIAALGSCKKSGATNRFEKFFSTNADTIDINGDYYTQKRASNTGAATMLAYQVNEGTLGGFVVNDLGRVTPEDRIGQKSLPTGIRWSNTFLPSAQTNGYASFNALDIKILEPTAQEIVRLIPTTKGVTEGSQMLVLCKGGSFVTLVGKAQLFGADQQTSNVVSTTDILGEVNPLQGNWTCNSPRSAATYQGLTFWADSQNRDIIQFGANGAIPISSKYNCSRLFRYLFSNLINSREFYINSILGAVNPYTNEYMVTFPAASPAISQPLLPTTSIIDPFDCYSSDGSTYIFNWNINKWVCNFQDTGTMINVGDDVYSSTTLGVTGFPLQWRNVLYHQFVGDAGVYYGYQHNAMIAVPFNSEYPAVKAPLAIRGDMSSYPNVTWIEADSMAELNGSTVGVANTQSWKMREGDAMATILRDRRSKGDISGNYTQAGISGNRLKGKVIKACLIWDGTIGDRDFTCGSVGLEYEKSSGHS